MIKDIIHLTILFFVIFDPLASFSVFTVATKNMNNRQRLRTAVIAVLVAMGLSYTTLFLGESIISIFGADIYDFKVASGIIIGILGIKMTLGQSITDVDSSGNTSAQAIAALIGTPLLTGPAAITTIIILVKEYGMLIPGISITIVLVFTTVLFLISALVNRIMNPTLIRVSSTFLGLIIISWGVKFIRDGILMR